MQIAPIAKTYPNETIHNTQDSRWEPHLEANFLNNTTLTYSITQPLIADRGIPVNNS